MEGTWTELDSIMVAVPGFEWCSIDQHNTVLDQSVGSDELVVGGVVDDVDDSGLLGNSFGSPVEVSFLESQSSELVVTSSDSDMPDSLVDFAGGEIEFGVGDWSGFLESSLLLVDGHSASSKSLLVSRVSVDSHGLK